MIIAENNFKCGKFVAMVFANSLKKNTIFSPNFALRLLLKKFVPCKLVAWELAWRDANRPNFHQHNHWRHLGSSDISWMGRSQSNCPAFGYTGSFNKMYPISMLNLQTSRTLMFLCLISYKSPNPQVSFDTLHDALGRLEADL